MKSPHHQRGAALLYVMLIFAASAIIAVGLMRSQRMDIIRTSRFVDTMQARYYALGAESYAQQQIAKNSLLAIQLFQTPISQKNTLFTIPNGEMQIQIEDLQGRFNINSLLSGNQAAIDHFIALCTQVKIDTERARNVAKRLKIAPPISDNTPKNESAVNPDSASIAVKEDGISLSDIPDAPNAEVASPPAQQAPSAPSMDDKAVTPGQWLVDPSELIDAGLTVTDYRKLAPYIAALPTQSLTINVNTASDIVLLAYVQDRSKIGAIRSSLASKGALDSKVDFAQLQIVDPVIGSSSDYFQIKAWVKVGSQMLQLHSTVKQVKQNDHTEIRVIARKWGG